MAVVVGVVLVSGGSDADPRTPAGLPGLPSPFLGTAVVGDGGLTAAVDAYGDVVDLRPSPAGPALIDNPAARQAAGTVPADTGIVPRVSVDGGPALPLWRADSVAQSYRPGTNVVRTVARFGAARAAVVVAAGDDELAVVIQTRAGGVPNRKASGGVAGGRERLVPSASIDVDSSARCARERRGGELDLLCGVGRALPRVSGAAAGDVRQRVRAVIKGSAADGRRWISRAEPLGDDPPAWARRMYERSLLVLHALTDSRGGAVAAGARDGWAYVWPRDAATAALALEAAGYEAEARRAARFLTGLDLEAAARFEGDGTPVPGRGPQGDAPGWVRMAAARLGLDATVPGYRREGLPDYQEGGGGEYLGNAISHAGDYASLGLDPGGLAPPIRRAFGTLAGLVREAHDPASGLDSAAGWAVRPFSIPPLHPIARRTLLHLSAAGTPYGITPGEAWHGGVDPWTAPTAWSAWALAALGDAEASAAPRRAHADRAAALRLLADLRRAATPAGSLPERVDAATGVPRSTTPLAWTHAFAVLTLLELWPSAPAL